MQSKHTAYIRAINAKGTRKYKILTAPTHEAYQTNLDRTGHTFYMYQSNGFKTWNDKYRKIPPNHILLDGSKEQIKADMMFDIVLSQNKFGQYQVLRQIADAYNIPLVSIEHTLPFPQWTAQDRAGLRMMRGDINVFISEYSVEQWGFSLDDPSVKIIHHGIDNDVFTSDGSTHNDGKILTVVNDWINRDWCCGWSIYQRVIKGLPINPLGDTKGFSKPAESTEDLVSAYKRASVFLNTSTISPVPTALMEAMSCGCPVVTTATCMIPSIVEDGVNGFISNDEAYLRDRVEWCLNNPEKAKEIGMAGRDTIVKRFSLEQHVNEWNSVFEKAFGIVRNQWE